jgi:hypothetical protein
LAGPLSAPGVGAAAVTIPRLTARPAPAGGQGRAWVGGLLPSKYAAEVL